MCHQRSKYSQVNESFQYRWNPLTSHQDIKATARNESMPTLRRAAGLDLTPMGVSSRKVTHPSAADEGTGSSVKRILAADDLDTAVERGDGENSVSGNSRDMRFSGTDDKRGEVNRSEPKLPGQGGAADKVDSDSIGTAASKSTGLVQEQPSVGSVKLSSLVAKAPQPDGSDRKAKLGKVATVLSTTAGRGRQGEVRRRQELFEVWMCASS